MLGIPTVVDRLIQQALHQVLSPLFESSFSESSYGFRPERSAHQAVLKAREYVQSGTRWVVDIDLEKFFDRVNHDILMSRWHDESRPAGAAPDPPLPASRDHGEWAGRQRAEKERRKVGRSRRCCPTSCSTIWTRNWRDVGTRSAATPMIATSTCNRGERGNE